MLSILHGVDGLTFPLKKGILQIFIALKNPLPLAGFEPVNTGSDMHANHYTTEDGEFTLRWR
jgi:hypothetical protein